MPDIYELETLEYEKRFLLEAYLRVTKDLIARDKELAARVGLVLTNVKEEAVEAKKQLQAERGRSFQKRKVVRG